MLIKNHPNKNENTKTSFGTHKQSPKKLYKVGYSVYVFQQQYTARFYFIFFLVCKNAKNPKIKQPTCDFVLVYFFAFTSSVSIFTYSCGWSTVDRSDIKLQCNCGLERQSLPGFKASFV